MPVPGLALQAPEFAAAFLLAQALLDHLEQMGFADLVGRPDDAEVGGPYASCRQHQTEQEGAPRCSAVQPPGRTADQFQRVVRGGGITQVAGADQSHQHRIAVTVRHRLAQLGRGECPAATPLSSGEIVLGPRLGGGAICRRPR